MRIERMYFHTSIFISQRDMQGPITLKLKFPIFKNSVFEDQKIVSKNWPKSSKKKSRGCAPYPLLGLAELCTSLPPRWVLYIWPQWCWITRSVHFARWKVGPHRSFVDIFEVNLYWVRELTAYSGPGLATRPSGALAICSCSSLNWVAAPFKWLISRLHALDDWLASHSTNRKAVWGEFPRLGCIDVMVVRETMGEK